ncbi:MAG: hypothetical protein Q8O56_02860 [Solirubrobacteraceae bacterium]|nr:hypothetical protein [Solirubrobacteraceae bacterium]
MPDREDLADLPGLARFGVALHEAARSEMAGDRAGTAMRRWLRGAALALAVALGVAATAAATVAALRGTVIAAPDARILPAEQTSLDSSSLLTAPRSPDPAGGPPWALRLTRSQTGQTCTTVGQVRDGVFGIVGEDRVFRRIPPAIVDSCGRRLLLGSRIVAAPTNRATRSIVFGVAGSATRRAVLVTTGGRRPLALGERGTFVAALPGFPEDSAARVELTAGDGRVTRRSLGASPGLVPDIAGAPAWQLVRYALGTRRYCARLGDARRPPDRSKAPGDPHAGASMLPTACIARRGTFAWAAQALRLRSGERGTPGFDRWRYSNRPARTILLGIARESTLVRRVVITGAGAPRLLTPASDGTFALVLPASVDPRALQISVVLKDGTTQRGRSGHGIVADPVASRRPR